MTSSALANFFVLSLRCYSIQVLIAKLAEVQLVSSDEVAFLEDQCQALTDELKQSAVDKSLLHERVVELVRQRELRGGCLCYVTDETSLQIDS
jgi:hypothetical protein